MTKKTDIATNEAQEPARLIMREWTDDEIIENAMAGGKKPENYDDETLKKHLYEQERPNIASLVGGRIVSIMEVDSNGMLGLVVENMNQQGRALVMFTKEPLNPEPGFAFATTIK